MLLCFLKNITPSVSPGHIKIMYAYGVRLKNSYPDLFSTKSMALQNQFSIDNDGRIL